ASGQRALALVFGIGINVRFDPEMVPEELRDRMDWLERMCERPIDPNLLVACIALELERLTETIVQGRYTDLLAEWKKYSVTLGRTIKATTGATTIEGRAIDLSSTGGLIVEKADGERVTLHAGEVTI